MNKEYYQSLNEAYTSMYENAAQKAGRDSAKATRGIERNIGNFVSKTAKNVAGEASKALGSYQRGMTGKEIHPNKGPVSRMANQAGRNLNTLTLGGANLLKKGADAVGNYALGQAKERLNREDVQLMVGAYLLDSGLATTPQDASAIVEHMADEYLDHLATQVPDETVLELIEGGFAGISDAALEAAAAATQKRHKEQGYKVPGTQGVKDLFKIGTKKGQV